MNTLSDSTPAAFSRRFHALVLLSVLLVGLTTVPLWTIRGQAGLEMSAFFLLSVFALSCAAKPIVEMLAGGDVPRAGGANTLTCLVFIALAYTQIGALNWCFVRRDLTVFTADGEAHRWPQARVWTSTMSGIHHVAATDSPTEWFFSRREVAGMSWTGQ